MHKAFSNKKQHISFNNQKNKTIVICFEHAEYDLKQTVKKYLENKNYKTKEYKMKKKNLKTQILR